MSPNKANLAIIVRYLNNPSDENYQMEVKNFRSQSNENEAYFLEIEKTWLLSSKASRLEAINHKQSVKKFKAALSNSIGRSNHSFNWFRNVAALLMVALAGYWLYNQRSASAWIVKTTSQNQTDSVKLSDGSTIVLAPNSELRYPSKFNSELREIFLSKGQAFFQITKDPKHPFKVVMDQSDVQVLGTSFNLKLSSYDIDLGVKTGKVMFSPYKGGNSSILIAGQALTYSIKNKEFTTKTSQNADAWLTKQLSFDDTPLDEVCRQLSEFYNTPITLQNSHKTIKKLNATFSNKSLSEVLEILSETYNIEVSKQQNQIILLTH
jgi:transmembrane sensor